MENLKIVKGIYSPEVDFDAETGVLRMTGSSFPENAAEFFEPIYEWLNTYISDVGKSLQINLELDYLNTSSTKCVMDVLEILEGYQKQGGPVEVNWYYPEDDEDMLEMGEEIAEDLYLDLNFCPVVENV